MVDPLSLIIPERVQIETIFSKLLVVPKKVKSSSQIKKLEYNNLLPMCNSEFPSFVSCSFTSSISFTSGSNTVSAIHWNWQSSKLKLFNYPVTEPIIKDQTLWYRNTFFNRFNNLGQNTLCKKPSKQKRLHLNTSA